MAATILSLYLTRQDILFAFAEKNNDYFSLHTPLTSIKCMY